MKKEIKTEITNYDTVEHPEHYMSDDGLEAIDVIRSFTKHLSGMEAVSTANALKYLLRWKKKNGIEDLKKSRWYIDNLISDLEKVKPKEESNASDCKYLNGYNRCNCKKDTPLCDGKCNDYDNSNGFEDLYEITRENILFGVNLPDDITMKIERNNICEIIEIMLYQDRTVLFTMSITRKAIHFDDDAFNKLISFNEYFTNYKDSPKIIKCFRDFVQDINEKYNIPICKCKGGCGC